MMKLQIEYSKTVRERERENIEREKKRKERKNSCECLIYLAGMGTAMFPVSASRLPALSGAGGDTCQDSDCAS